MVPEARATRWAEGLSKGLTRYHRPRRAIRLIGEPTSSRRGDHAMNESVRQLGDLRQLTWSHVLLVLAILVGCRLLIGIVRLCVHRAAESAPSHWRLSILRMAPLAT
jgi:hypothetical protein